MNFNIDYILWLLTALLFLLLLAPVAYFLIYGWPDRKKDVLNSMSVAAATEYMRCFHSTEDQLAREAGVTTGPGANAMTVFLKDVHDSEKILEDCESALENTPATDLTRPAKETAKTNAEAALAQVQTPAYKMFNDYYKKQFGRQRFVVPIGLLAAFALGFLVLCAYSATKWHSGGLADPNALSVATVLAILGGYTWVLFDFIQRAQRDDFAPSDLLWGAFRLVISVPIGYVFGQVIKSNDAAPMAYLLGTLPTSTIMAVGRRMVSKWVGLTDAPDGYQSQIQILFSVDTYAAERLAAEGITSVPQLAYEDPVKLSIRSGLSFSAVITSVCEAMLAYYAGERKKAEKIPTADEGAASKSPLAIYRKYGLCSSFECFTLWDDLNESMGSENQQRAASVVAGLAADLALPEMALKNVLREIACDPYTQFHYECWGSSME